MTSHCHVEFTGLLPTDIQQDLQIYNKTARENFWCKCIKLTENFLLGQKLISILLI